MSRSFIGVEPAYQYAITVFSTDTRKGAAVGIDFAIGMSVFILMVAVGLYYASVIAAPSSPFSEQVRGTSTQASASFERLAEWTVYQAPIMIEAPTTVDRYPIEARYAIPGDHDPASVSVSSGSTALDSQYTRQDNNTAFLAPVSDGTNRYRLSYTTGTDLDPVDQTDHINKSGDTVETENYTATTDTAGIDDLTYDGEQYIVDSEFETIGTHDTWTNGSVRASSWYENGSVRFFGYVGQTRITQEAATSSDYTNFELSSSFSQLDTDSDSPSLADNGTYFDGTTDTATFTYSSGGTTYGFTITGESMSMEVSRPVTDGNIHVNITMSGTGRDLMIMSHTGDASSVSAETTMFLEQNKTVSLLQEKTGIADHELEALEDMSTDAIAAELGITGMNYNITFTDHTYGSDIPTGQDVAVLEYPFPNLYRWGNTTREDLRLAVWLG